MDDLEESNRALKDELDRILQSNEFAGATRLQQFLSYVVTEKIAGRVNGIVGKTIAQDVYNRNVGSMNSGVGVVRVDAGRLRRRLAVYYVGTGKSSAVQISIGIGNYVPCLGPKNIHHAKRETSSSFVKYLVVIAVLSTAFAIGTGTFFSMRVLIQSGVQDDTSLARETSIKQAQRQAMLEKSPASLQAYNLANQARSLIFPPLDPHRLASTLGMFEQAIRLDKNYAGGHAGVAQTLAMMAMIGRDKSQNAALLDRATQAAKHAIDLAPMDSWSRSADAWVNFADRNYKDALEISQQARALNPADLQTADSDALISLFSGEFERALNSADPERHSGRKGERFVFRNAFAAASFHLGRYEDTLEYFSLAARSGDAVSPISLSYQIAASMLLGRDEAARNIVLELDEAWPGFPIQALFLRIFQQPEHANEILGPMHEAGWEM